MFPLGRSSSGHKHPRCCHRPLRSSAAVPADPRAFGWDPPNLRPGALLSWYCLTETLPYCTHLFLRCRCLPISMRLKCRQVHLVHLSANRSEIASGSIRLFSKYVEMFGLFVGMPQEYESPQLFIFQSQPTFAIWPTDRVGGSHLQFSLKRPSLLPSIPQHEDYEFPAAQDVKGSRQV